MSAEAAEGADTIIGNVYDKYGTKNPIARRLMKGFLDATGGLFAGAAPRTVLEVGCGEGRLATQLIAQHRPERFLATDLSLELRDRAADSLIEFEQASIYDLPYDDGSFDLVVCCEVLEHLERPGEGLGEICRVARDHVLVSTPREPLWRAMNMARGKYLSDLGNTPGHVQQFSKDGLMRLVSTRARIVETRHPIPWTVVLAKPLR